MLIAYLLTSISITKGFDSFSIIRTRLELRACLSSSNTVVYYKFYLIGRFFFIRRVVSASLRKSDSRAVIYIKALIYR